jgi:hypothetical protein
MVDFEPTVLYLLGLIVPAAFAVAQKVGELAINWLRTKTPFGFLIPEEVVAENLRKALEFGVAYATQEAKKANLKVEFNNVFVANAVTYVKESVPEALKRFDITDERLARMVQARLDAI